MTPKEIKTKVEWRDLIHLSTREMLIENCITLPWIIISLSLSYFEYYLLALPFSAIYFLTGLRQVHNGFHKSLGTNKFLTWLSLFLNSISMMTSIHAVEFNHLRHHKYCLTEKDYEGRCVNMSWFGAILYGPVHIFMIHKITFQLGNLSIKLKALAELLAILIFIYMVIYFEINFLIYHVIAMVIGEFLSAFFAVWTVHHDTEGDLHFARTQREKWKNIISFNMFYHMEHHLFPAVPTIKLPELARRIDRAFPEIPIKQTF